MQKTWVLLLFACHLTTAAVASAQTTDAARTEEARGAFERGVAAYEAGSFEEALASFQRAYALTENAELLFNIGTVADRLRRDALALESYEGYLAAHPETPDRANIQARIDAIRAAQVTPEPTPVVTPPPAAADPGPGPWILIAAGGASALAGAALLLAVAVDLDTASRADTWAVLSGPYERVPIMSAVGWPLLGVGLAAVGAGLGWMIAGSGSGGERPTTQVRLGPAGVLVQGTF